MEVDVIDFPRAFEISGSVMYERHEKLCSYRQTMGGILCDCRVITKHKEYLDGVLHTRRGKIFKKRPQDVAERG